MKLNLSIRSEIAILFLSGLVLSACRAQPAASNPNSQSTAFQQPAIQDISPVFKTPTSTAIDPKIASPTNTQMDPTAMAFGQMKILKMTAYAPTAEYLAKIETLRQKEMLVWLQSRNVGCPFGYSVEMATSVKNDSNDQWTVYTCSPHPNEQMVGSTTEPVDYSKRFTQVLNNTGSPQWTIPLGGLDWSNRPNVKLETYRWSRDGKYLFFVPYLFEKGGCGGGWKILFLDTGYLYRLNLITGQFESLLPNAKAFFSYSISPDDHFLAYVNADDPKIVHLRDLNSGTENKIILDDDYVDTGIFVWSPDSSKLFFAGGLSGWEDGKSGMSIFRVTIKTMYLQALLVNDSRLLVPYSRWSDTTSSNWTNDYLLNVTSLNGNSEFYNRDLCIDIRTGKVVDVTTPTPVYERVGTPSP